MGTPGRLARIGWMERMTQFKDKSGGKNAEQMSLGLLAYLVAVLIRPERF